MIDLAFVFTVFMVTLGPIKVIPGFYKFTKDFEPSECRRLALRGVFFATVISLAIALVMPVISKSWLVTPDDLRIAGGILLFAAAFDLLRPGSASSEPQDPPNHPAISPIAIPIVITPWGAAAIMIAMGLASKHAEVVAVLSNLLFIMALNLGGMWFARHIIAMTGVVFFKIVGWVFAVLQSGLAIHIIFVALKNLGFVAQP